MTCGLSDEELFILDLLYSNRNLRSNRGYHSDKLNKLFQKRFGEDTEYALRRLINAGYISKIGKSPPKYFIDNIPKAFFALGQHGYSVTPGRIRRL